MTWPIAVQGSCQRAQTASTSASRAGSTIAAMRSCDSEIMISNGCMPCSRTRHAVELQLDADAAARRHLGGRRGEARGAQILHRDDEPARGQLERALDQLLAGERVADLHARALVLVALVQVLRGQHARAADAVAPGGGAEQHDQVAGARRARAHQLVGAQQADAERVDERVGAVGRRRRPSRRRRSGRRRSCRSRRCRARCRGTARAGAPRRAGRAAASRRSAIGRAPIAKMSRRMPPTPVAAPW